MNNKTVEQIKSDIIGKVLIEIEKEKTKLYESNAFYGELEKVFALLSDIQEKIKNI